MIRLYDIWGLKELNGKKIDPSKGMILEMNTSEMTFMGNASCNSIFGTLESSQENKLSFLNIGSTRKMCPDINLETAYINSLKKVKSYHFENLNLLLLDENENVIIRYIKMD